MTFGRHADDELVAVDRVVRQRLGVRDGQTIRDRARELLIRGSTQSHHSAAVALFDHDPTDPWRGLRAAAKLLQP